MPLSAAARGAKSSIQWFFEELAQTFAEESTQWFLWLPVGLGIGAVTFLWLLTTTAPFGWVRHFYCGEEWHEKVKQLR